METDKSCCFAKRSVDGRRVEKTGTSYRVLLLCCCRESYPGADIRVDLSFQRSIVVLLSNGHPGHSVDVFDILCFRVSRKHHLTKPKATMAPQSNDLPTDGTVTTTSQASDNPPMIPKGKNAQLETTMESLVRITLAGFGGSLVGLAQQRQQPTTGTVSSSSSSAASAADGSNMGSRQGRRRPPSAASVANQKNSKGNQPRTWALSCMIFGLILETTRRSSPTSALLDLLYPNERNHAILWNRQVRDTAVTAVGDYTLGGTISGLVGALAGWTDRARTTLSANAMQVPAGILASKAGRRPLIMWGLGAGMSLGLMAGLFQAGIDVGNLYLQEQQQLERQRRQAAAAQIGKG